MDENFFVNWRQWRVINQILLPKMLREEGEIIRCNGVLKSESPKWFTG